MARSYRLRAVSTFTVVSPSLHRKAAFALKCRLKWPYSFPPILHLAAGRLSLCWLAEAIVADAVTQPLKYPIDLAALRAGIVFDTFSREP